MTSTGLNVVDLRRALLFIADEIINAESRLNALDAESGDGDHGITMRVGFEAVKQHLEQVDVSVTFEQLLRGAAQVFMQATGGAIGVILAKMLMGAGSVLRGARELGTPELNSMLVAMEAAIAKAGGAKPGDKTILDSVHAACRAAEAAFESHRCVSDSLSLAAAAAEAAAEDTANMVCRVGRASRLGERTLGHPDPGAVSFSIMMRAFEQSAAAR